MSESPVPAVNPAGTPAPGAPGTAEPTEPSEVSDPSGEPDEGEGESEPQRAAAPPPKQRIKLKSRQGEKEVEEEFDEDQIREWKETYAKRREHARAASQRMEEAANARKELEQFFGGLKNDPMQLFELAKRAGLDPDQVAASYAQRWVEQQQLTPEQRAFQEREAQLRQREAEIEDWRGQQAEEQRVAKVAEFRNQFAQNLKALVPKYELPDDPFTAQDMAKIVSAQIRAGDQPDYEVAADLLRERLDNQLSSHLTHLAKVPGALARKYPQIVEQLRREGLEYATRAPEPTRATGKQTERPVAARKPPKTWAEQEAEDRRRRFNIR